MGRWRCGEEVSRKLAGSLPNLPSSTQVHQKMTLPRTATLERKEQKSLLTQPSVRFKKTINTLDEHAQPLSVNAQK